MIRNIDLQEYSVNAGDLYSVDKIRQTPLGLERVETDVGIIHDVMPFTCTYRAKEGGYMEYTQSYTIFVNLDLIFFEQVVFYNRRQWLEDGFSDCEHRTSSRESDRFALYEKYGSCIFRVRRCL